MKRKLRIPNTESTKMNREEYTRMMGEEMEKLDGPSYGDIIGTMKKFAELTSTKSSRSNKIMESTLDLMRERRHVLEDEKKRICKLAREAFQNDIEQWKVMMIEKAVKRRSGIKRDEKKQI